MLGWRGEVSGVLRERKKKKEVSNSRRTGELQFAVCRHRLCRIGSFPPVLQNWLFFHNCSVQQLTEGKKQRHCGIVPFCSSKSLSVQSPSKQRGTLLGEGVTGEGKEK